MYESPIDLIQREICMNMDDAIMKAVYKVGINVDKDELLHALAYDRSQYQLGFIDGKREAMKEIVHCKDCVNWQTDWDTRADGCHFCAMIDLITEENFYCRDGESKDHAIEKEECGSI